MVLLPLPVICRRNFDGFPTSSRNKYRPMQNKQIQINRNCIIPTMVRRFHQWNLARLSSVILIQNHRNGEIIELNRLVKLLIAAASSHPKTERNCKQCKINRKVLNWLINDTLDLHELINWCYFLSDSDSISTRSRSWILMASST